MSSVALAILAGYGLLINIVGYAAMAYDKRQARKHGSRVPEKRLFLLAFLGGAFGVFAGMRKFRHKTQHLSFQVLVPVAMVWSVILYYNVWDLIR
jgi:uncharacterized membrane protein YsdA (DUF1294 family)